MIYSIVDSILPYLQSLNFADKVGGISYIIEKPILTQDNQTVVKRFPAIQNTNKNQCDLNDYIDLIPDDTLKSLMYFELISDILQEDNERFQEYKAQVKLICWFNLRNINENLTNCEQLLQLVNNAIPFRLNDNGGVYRITVTTADKRIRDKTIFSAYSYVESEKQYLIYPFDFGHINLTIDYRVDKCADDIVIDPNSCNDLQPQPFAVVIENGIQHQLFAGQIYTCQCSNTETMRLETLNTGELTANTTVAIKHDYGNDFGATDMVFVLLDENDQERGFNILMPDPSDPLNIVLIEVGDYCANGLTLKTILTTV